MNTNQFEVCSNLGIVEGEYIRMSNDFAGLKCEQNQRKQYDEYYVSFEVKQEVSLEQILELAKTFKVVIIGNSLTIDWS